jgi:Protein of unknown function (DUF3352)
MTDDQKTTTTDAAATEDATTRVPTTATGPSASTPATAPLAPPTAATSNAASAGHEPAWASGPVSASPVLPPSKPRSGGRLRWAAGLAVVALVILATAAVAALVTGQTSSSTVLGYVPAGTTAYGEVRLDLPGDQRAATGAFLSKFPGFADQAALDSKLDEMLDELVKAATDNEQSYTADIKPWFDGELAFSVGPLPPAAAVANGGPSVLGSSRALALLSIKDQALAQAWFDAAIAKMGAKTTSENYNGATLTVFEPEDGVTGALAMIDGKVAAAGDIASVKAAVDTKGSSGFASEPGPKAALDSVDSDHVAFGYVALRPLMDWSNDLNKASSSAVGGAAMEGISDSILKLVPEWTSYWLRFENDAIVMEATAPRAETATGPTENRKSTIAEHVPAAAIFAANSHDLGKSLKEMLDIYRSDATYKPMIEQLDQGLDLVGGADGAFGWAGDAAVVVDAANGTPGGGLVVEPTDAEAAQRLFTALRTFVTLGGDQVGAAVRDEAHNGTTITIVSLGDLRALSGIAGGSASAVPLPTGKIEIAYAVTDDVVVIGSGPGFVKSILDTTPSTSLAADETYKKLADRAGTGTGGSYVDISGVRELFEKLAATNGEPKDLAEYETDIKPFLLPLDAIFAAGSIDGDLTKSVIYITVK